MIKAILISFFFWSNAFANITGPQIPSQTGQSGKFLETNGSILSWGTAGGGGGTPGSPANSIQYNSAGSFGGISAMVFDSTKNLVELNGASGLDVGQSFANFRYDTYYASGDKCIGSSNHPGVVAINDAGFHVYEAFTACTVADAATSLIDVLFVGSAGGIKFGAYGAGALQTDLSGNVTPVSGGTTGNVLTFDGTSWVSQAPAAAGLSNPVANNVWLKWNDTSAAATDILILDNNNATILGAVVGADVPFISQGVGSNTYGYVLQPSNTPTYASKLAAGITPGSNEDLTKVELSLAYGFVSATGNVFVEIHADNAGEPDTTVIATSDLYDATLITNSLTAIPFNFSPAVSLTSGTPYWIVLLGDGTFNSGSLIGWGGYNLSTYPALQYNGSAWGAAVGQYAFSAYTTTAAGTIKLAADTIQPQGNIIFDKASTGYVKTADAAATYGLALQSGDITSGSGGSGNVYLYSGVPASGGHSGTASLYSSNVAAGSGNSGQVYVNSGDADSGNTGLVSIAGGYSASGTANGVQILGGDSGSSGTPGDVYIAPGAKSGGGTGKLQLDDLSGTISAGQVWTATASDGAGHWAAAGGGGSSSGPARSMQASDGSGGFTTGIAVDNVGGVRSSGAATSGWSGTGVEFIYSGGIGYIQTYDRTSNAYAHMSIDGSPLDFNGNSGAAVIIHGTVQMTNFGAGTATFDASGNISSVSDERLKDIQRPFMTGLEGLKGIHPITYKWKPESKMETEHEYSGFSAQNVGANIPEAMGTNAEGFHSIQDRAILAALVNAVNELSHEVDELKKVQVH